MADLRGKIGIKKIKKALNDCAQDPQAPGWFKIVADSNDEYLLRRSIESLRELLTGGPDTNVDQAISLLGLLKARQSERLQTKRD